MNSRTSLIEALPAKVQLPPKTKPLLSADDSEELGSPVVDCSAPSDPFDDAGLDPAERDRQASLEFLHRQVMG